MTYDRSVSGLMKVHRYPLTQTQSTMLDLLRAVAAQMVLLGHSMDFFGVFSSFGQLDRPPQIQQIGVVVFFLLSGFLITASAISGKQHSNYRFAHFFNARAVRIFSAYIPALILIALIDALPFYVFKEEFPIARHSVELWFANLLMFQEFDFLGLTYYGTGFTLWSLATEWWLYLAFGSLLFVTSVWRQPFVYPLIALAFFAVFHASFGGTAPGITFAWLYGCIAYLLLARCTNVPWLNSQLVRLTWILCFTIAAVRLWMFAPHPINKAYDPWFLIIFGIGFGFLIADIARWQFGFSPNARRCIKRFADYSYTLYLIHFTLLTVLFEWKDEWPPILMLIAAVLFCNGFAALMGIWVEWRYDWRTGLINRINKPR